MIAPFSASFTSGRLGVLFWFALSALLLSASLRISSKDSEAPRLRAGNPSIQTPARRFLEALRDRDLGALADLTMTETEFRESIWPFLPAARPHTNLTADFVWTQMSIRSRRDLNRTWRRYRGRVFELREVIVQGPVTELGSARIHRDVVLEVHDEDEKATQVKLFGSILELNGEFKIYSYVL